MHSNMALATSVTMQEAMAGVQQFAAAACIAANL
jgi:hypothetical protein